MNYRISITTSRTVAIILSMLTAAGCAGTVRSAPSPVRVPIPESVPVEVTGKIYPPVGGVVPVFVAPVANGPSDRYFDPNRIRAIDRNGNAAAPLREKEAAERAGGADILFHSVSHRNNASSALASAVMGGLLTAGTLGIVGPSLLMNGGTLAFSADGRLRSVMLNERTVTWSPSPVEEGLMLLESSRNHGAEFLEVPPRGCADTPACREKFLLPEGGYLFFPAGEYQAIEIPIANRVANQTEIVQIPRSELMPGGFSQSFQQAATQTEVIR
jgi:hypothetical protein